MKHKTVDKHIRISEKENEDWKKKAERTGLTESALIRLLVSGYYPKEKPDERFYYAMNRISAFNNTIRKLAKEVHFTKSIDVLMLYEEVKSWRKFREEMERRYLRPDKNDRIKE